MIIYKVKSVFNGSMGRNRIERYFDTLEHAEAWVKNAGCEHLDEYGGIFEQEPDEYGQFETTRCLKAW